MNSSVSICFSCRRFFAFPALVGKDSVNISFIGSVAISGADTVAYFKKGKAIIGVSDYSYKWNGANWRFKSAENRDAFAKNPSAYAPQFGGYCAYAVSRGYTASIDPEAWSIVEGKLYLNYSESVRNLWSFEELLFFGLFLLWKILGELLDRLTAKPFDHGVNALFD